MVYVHVYYIYHQNVMPTLLERLSGRGPWREDALLVLPPCPTVIVYVHTCVYTCIHIHIYTYIYIHIHAYVCIYIYIYIYMCVYICIHICICIYMYRYIHIYAFIYMYMYVSKCIYIIHASILLGAVPKILRGIFLFKFGIWSPHMRRPKQ